jgi:23S rRNA pseudouridine2605 synthase
LAIRGEAKPQLRDDGSGSSDADRLSPCAQKRGERIAKVLARAGVASRREVERLIAEGRVMLNGAVVTHPAILIDAHDKISVDGKPVPLAMRSRLWRYHKPAGLVTTARDPEGRPTVFATLPRDLPRVISVGRLDINTEGLLLMTNDGGLARFLEHPAQGFSRTYRVRAHGYVDDAALARLAMGVVIDGIRYRPVDVKLERRRRDNVWLTITLREGKNREVKRLLEHCGLQVTRLIRISYGNFMLGDLRPGAVDEVQFTSLAGLLSGYFA